MKPLFPGSWNEFGSPDPGYAEQVYFMELAAGADGHTTALLTSADRSKGVSLRYDTVNLPCFSLWKNTVGSADGYVTGLEPATNFPNPRSFEESHGRVTNLAPGESNTLKLNIGMLVSSATVATTMNQVEVLKESSPEISSQPTSDWCSP